MSNILMPDQPGIRVIGTAEIVLTDALGNVKQREEGENMIVTSGLQWIARRCSQDTVTTTNALMNWMELGSSATTVATGDVTLNAYLTSRTSATISLVSTTVVNDTVQYVATFGAAVGTGAVQEAGVFNASGNNVVTMLNRIVFSVINKGASDTLTITWKVKIA
jgi:hypothetical protein